MIWILVAALALAFANGSNDNFKGVATLEGSATCSHGKALAWATVMTFVGSIAATYFASELLTRFGGKGLVGADVAADPVFIAAVASAAAGTVLLATRFGMPTSTTHALIGALIGAGMAANGPVHYEVLSDKFLLPLFLSPLVAVLGTMALYPTLRIARRGLGITRDSCFCIGEETVEVVPGMTSAHAIAYEKKLSVRTGKAVSCHTRYQGHVLGLSAARALDAAHFASAGVLSFARGLNDLSLIHI